MLRCSGAYTPHRTFVIFLASFALAALAPARARAAWLLLEASGGEAFYNLSENVGGSPLATAGSQTSYVADGRLTIFVAPKKGIGLQFLGHAQTLTLELPSGTSQQLLLYRAGVRVFAETGRFQFGIGAGYASTPILHQISAGNYSLGRALYPEAAVEVAFRVVVERSRAFILGGGAFYALGGAGSNTGLDPTGGTGESARASLLFGDFLDGGVYFDWSNRQFSTSEGTQTSSEIQFGIQLSLPGFNSRSRSN